MRKLLLLLLLLGIAPANAADNAVIVDPGTIVPIRCKDVGAGVQSCLSIPGDASGNIAWGTAGTANANILTVQGIAAMTPILTTSQGTGAASSALSGNPFRVALSDGTNTQNWLAAIGLTDAVNGNNMGAVGTYMWNGATWDRVPGTAAGGLKVNTGTTTTFGNAMPAAGVAIGANGSDNNIHSMSVTTWGTAPTGLFALATNNNIPDGSDATQGAKADAVCATAASTACSEIAMLKFIANSVSGPVPTQANTVSIGAVGLSAPTTGGCTGQVILTAANNNATLVKASAGTLCSVRWENTTTSLFSIRFYDSATTPSGGAPCNSATNVVSNDVAQSNATSPGGVSNLGPYGQAFATGIVVCVTGANANNDNTNAVTGLNLNLSFK